MADLDNAHDVRGIVDLVDDSIESLTETVAILAPELLAAWGARICGKPGNAIDDEPAVFLRRQFLDLV